MEQGGLGMLRPLTWTLGLAVCLLMAGCVERRFVITTDPPGAIVNDEKGMPIGGTPADKQFTYYGKYVFTVMRDGYQTAIVEEDVKAPWYEWFLIDFVSENLVPWVIRDVRYVHVPLQPIQMVPAEQVLQQAEILRQRGQGIGTQLPIIPGPPIPVAGGQDVPPPVGINPTPPVGAPLPPAGINPTPPLPPPPLPTPR